jgi:enoyl-CoA hydratase/carnithine racemase
MIGFDIAGGVTVLSVDNPPANVMTTKVRGALNQTLDRLTARSDLKALILCRAVDKRDLSKSLPKSPLSAE